MLWLHSICSRVDGLWLLSLLLLWNLLGLWSLWHRHANLLLRLLLLVHSWVRVNSTLNDLVRCTCAELSRRLLAYDGLPLDALLFNVLLCLRLLLTDSTLFLRILSWIIRHTVDRLPLYLRCRLLELRLARCRDCLRLLHGLGGVLGRGRHLRNELKHLILHNCVLFWSLIWLLRWWASLLGLLIGSWLLLLVRLL